MNEKDDKDLLSLEQQAKFAQLYCKLTPAQRFGLNWKITRVIFSSAASWRDLLQAVNFARLLLLPYVAPWMLGALALIVWAWAMATGAAALWLACLALSAAAVLQLRPLALADSDEVE